MNIMDNKLKFFFLSFNSNDNKMNINYFVSLIFISNLNTHLEGEVQVYNKKNPIIIQISQYFFKM